MRKFRTQIRAGLLLATTGSVALAQAPSGTAIPVTVDNYNRAESDVYFGLHVKTGGFGKFMHRREPVPCPLAGRQDAFSRLRRAHRRPRHEIHRCPRGDRLSESSRTSACQLAAVTAGSRLSRPTIFSTSASTR
jgi:hypothetical protein